MHCGLKVSFCQFFGLSSSNLMLFFNFQTDFEFKFYDFRLWYGKSIYLWDIFKMLWSKVPTNYCQDVPLLFWRQFLPYKVMPCPVEIQGKAFLHYLRVFWGVSWPPTRARKNKYFVWYHPPIHQLEHNNSSKTKFQAKLPKPSLKIGSVNKAFFVLILTKA